MNTLDDFDRKILHIIQDNAHTPLHTISEHVGLSISACSRRIKHYEDTHIIQKRVTILNPQKINKESIIFIEISLEKQSQKLLSEFEEAILTMPEILECHLMGGDCDYLIKIRVRDIKEYEQFHKKYLTTLPGVSKICTLFGLRTIIDKTQINL